MKKAVDFEDIEKARKALGLKEVCTMEDIKKAYRELSLKYHPDKGNAPEERKQFEEKFKHINNCYKILLDYCYRYPISFARQKVRIVEEGEYNKYHRERFYDTWW
ncbi:MAG: J domain-containing protein [Actinomycetota bacterium]